MKLLSHCLGSLDEQIQEFKDRILTEPEFCAELYEMATIRLMAAKYAYYILSESFITDDAYDICEGQWYVMGRALGILEEDETSPCIDWNKDHPYAQQGIELANKFLKKETEFRNRI